MTTRAPLPPLPDLATLTRTTHPVFAAITHHLLGRRTTGRMYEDSPYIAAAHTRDPEPDDEDNGPWCRTEAP